MGRRVRFEAWVWVPSKGWKRLGGYSVWEKAYAKCEEFHPLETKLHDVVRGTSTYAGVLHVMSSGNVPYHEMDAHTPPPQPLGLTVGTSWEQVTE